MRSQESGESAIPVDCAGQFPSHCERPPVAFFPIDRQGLGVRPEIKLGYIKTLRRRFGYSQSQVSRRFGLPFRLRVSGRSQKRFYDWRRAYRLTSPTWCATESGWPAAARTGRLVIRPESVSSQTTIAPALSR